MSPLDSGAGFLQGDVIVLVYELAHEGAGPFVERRTFAASVRQGSRGACLSLATEDALDG
jgi:hypothetical protein